MLTDQCLSLKHTLKNFCIASCACVCICIDRVYIFIDGVPVNATFQSLFSVTLPGCLSCSWTWISVHLKVPFLQNLASHLRNFQSSNFYDFLVIAILTVLSISFFPPPFILHHPFSSFIHSSPPFWKYKNIL